MKIIDNPNNPIFVSPALSPRKLLIYIGERKRGKTRIAAITTKEARVLAHALLSEAEKKDEQLLESALYAAFNP